jgi:hypothetical protein
VVESESADGPLEDDTGEELLGPDWTDELLDGPD